MAFASFDTPHELLDGNGLIPLGLKGTLETKDRHGIGAVCPAWARGRK